MKAGRNGLTVIGKLNKSLLYDSSFDKPSSITYGAADRVVSMLVIDEIAFVYSAVSQIEPVAHICYAHSRHYPLGDTECLAVHQSGVPIL